MAKVNLREKAVEFKRWLDRLQASAQAARDTLTTNRLDLAACYTDSVRFLGLVSQMVGAGLTAEVIGPYLDAEYGTDYASIEDTYNNLKNTTLPALRDKIKEHEVEVISGGLSASTYTIVLNGSLQTATQSELETALDNVLSDLSTILD